MMRLAIEPIPQMEARDASEIVLVHGWSKDKREGYVPVARCSGEEK